MKSITTKLFVLGIVVLMFVSTIPFDTPLSQSESDGNYPEAPILPDMAPDVPPPGQMNLTNDYQKIWEPNAIRGSTHGVAATPSKNLVAVAGGWLSDKEVHVYRWSSVRNEYYHVWDSGDGVIQDDVLSVAIDDADNNGRYEIVAGCADGRIYVFEQIGVEEGIYYFDFADNKFELVWDSGNIIDKQVWSVTTGDLNNDGFTEIIAGAWDSRVYVFKLHMSSDYPQCPEHYMEFELVWHSGDWIDSRVYDVEMGDTDRDFREEIIASSHNGKVYIFEHIPCWPYNFDYAWDSGNTMYNPVRSIAVSNDLDSDQYGEIVATSYGLGVFLFNYDSTLQDYSSMKLNRPISTWEKGSLPTTGKYLGAEADEYIDKKVWGWEEHGIYEPADIPYPWSSEHIGGASAIGGPLDGNFTTFDATESYVYLDSWDFVQGNETGEFMAPYDMEFDQDYNAYVIDPVNQRVTKLSPEGIILNSWGEHGNESGQFYMPYGLCVDSFGNVYVADTLNNRVQKFSSDGVFLNQWGEQGAELGQFSMPVDVDVGPENSLFVLDANNSRIQKINQENGSVITTWGVNGSAAGEFYQPFGIRISSEGIVYVADTGNNRIQVFDLEGSFLFEWGQLGTGPGDFDQPSSLAIDDHGQVYVTDHVNDRIQKFRSDGGFIAEWGTEGSAAGEFQGPKGIDIAQDKSICIIDSGNTRMQRFGLPSYEFVASFGSQGNETGQFDTVFAIDFDAEGNMYVSDSYNYRIQKFGPDGSFITSWPVPDAGGEGTAVPHGIAVHPAGEIYVVDRYGNRVIIFDGDGTVLDSFGDGGSDPGYFDDPIDIEIDVEGSIYVSDLYNDRIQVFDSDGAFQRIIGSPGSTIGELDNPYGLDIGPDGHLYVGEVANNRAQEFFLNGTPVTIWDSSGANVHDVLMSYDGSLYTTDAMNGRIYRYAPGGTQISVTEGKVGDFLSNADLGLPHTLKMDADGDIHVASLLISQIIEIRPEYDLRDSATAVADFGEYEALTGDGTENSDLYLYFQGSDVELDNIQLKLSPEGKNFTPIKSENLAKTFFFGYSVVRADIDPLLRDMKWREIRYVDISVFGGATYELDGGAGTVARPIDSALVVTTGHIDQTVSGDDTEEIIIGTASGAVMAYNGETGAQIWESHTNTPRFSFGTGVWDIVELNEQGRMPTFVFDETVISDASIPSPTFSFVRFHGYTMGDIDGTDALDLLVTIQDGGISRLLYFRNTGTNDEPVWSYQSGYWPAHSSSDTNQFASWASPTLADLDNDGDLDLVVVDGGNDIDTGAHIIYIRYFERTSSSYWTERADKFPGPEGLADDDDLLPKLSFHDMDGDGDLDLTMGLNATLYYFQHLGSGGSFSWMRDDSFYEDINEAIPNTLAFDKVAFSDFDLDNDFDLTVSHGPWLSNHSDYLLYPNASWFTYFENTGTLTGPQWKRCRSMYEPDFRGTPLDPQKGHLEISMVDMNGDGLLDIVGIQDSKIQCYYASLDHNSYMVATYPYIHMLEVDKRSTSWGYDAYDSWDNSEITDYWTYSIQFGDTDSDGKKEVIVGSFDNNIYTFEQVANNTYRRAWRSNDIVHDMTIGFNTYTLWDDVRDLVLDDQDNDGKQEIIAVAGERLLVFENVDDDSCQLIWNSGSMIQEEMGMPSPSYSEIPVVTEVAAHKDMDDDGQSEIVVASNEWLIVFEHEANNSYNVVWSWKHTTHEGGEPIIHDLLTGDSDGDGKPEMLLVGADTYEDEYGTVDMAQGFLTIWETVVNETGHFQDDTFQMVFDVGTLQSSYNKIRMADYDNNGKIELFVGSGIGIDIWMNDGDNSFADGPLLTTEKAVTALALGNTDGDSSREIIAGIGKKIAVLEQNHSYPLTSHYYDRVWNSTTLGNTVTDIVIGDTNRNNRLEILATAAEGYLYSFEWSANLTVQAAEPASLLISLESSSVCRLGLLQRAHQKWQTIPAVRREVL
ncbi:MAG: hypothetical protein GF309_15880 [Candidatus Lokiarchaeota archaeon]|nr:hypothetical protein [Candidatus Lokiarchaeota archaeon]